MSDSLAAQSQARIKTHQASRQVKILFFFAAHIPLALLINQYPAAALLHALFALAAGLLVLVEDRTPRRLINVAAYIAGAEVLWRMVGAGVFHEYGKYAISLLLILGMLKWRKKVGVLPFLYFILLLPACILTVMSENLNLARQDISANLSGPLALAVSVMFFTRVKIDREQLASILDAIIAPCIGIAVLALASILGAETIVFHESSNFVTSGGFGPNQVSAVLGLGALCCFLFFLIRLPDRPLLLYGLLFIWLLSHSFLTFSRGGIVNFAVAAAAITLIFLWRNPRRFYGLFLILIFTIMFAVLVLPRINAYTGGMLEQRYTEIDLSNRDKLMRADLNAFRDWPIIGVGPGQADPYYIEAIGTRSAAHTEYTRLLAEHGLLGGISLIILIAIIYRSFRYNKSWSARGLMLVFALWALVEMAHAAMRISAISYLIGLSTCIFVLNDFSWGNEERRS